MLRKNLIVLKRGHDEAKVIKFDTQAGDDDAVSLFEIKKTSCLEPKTAVFESSWSDCTNKVQIIKTGEWRFKRPVTNKDDCRRCGLCALYCPVGCVTERPSGHYLQDYAYCKGCGVCAFECPAGAIDMVLEEE
ncbi:MAG: 4Fe-4S binding protein [Deltaproteobacteria bacterium]|nr:4Fe-4S binding protein [Deltaproteobacteria bacterium]